MLLQAEAAGVKSRPTCAVLRHGKRRRGARLVPEPTAGRLERGDAEAGALHERAQLRGRELRHVRLREDGRAAARVPVPTGADEQPNTRGVTLWARGGGRAHQLPPMARRSTSHDWALGVVRKSVPPGRSTRQLSRSECLTPLKVRVLIASSLAGSTRPSACVMSPPTCRSFRCSTTSIETTTSNELVSSG